MYFLLSHMKNFFAAIFFRRNTRSLTPRLAFEMQEKATADNLGAPKPIKNGSAFINIIALPRPLLYGAIYAQSCVDLMTRSSLHSKNFMLAPNQEIQPSRLLSKDLPAITLPKSRYRSD